MEVLYSIFLQAPTLLKFAFISFVIGIIGLAIDYAIRPKPLNKSPLFSNPPPSISIFGIIGLFSLGLTGLSAAYGTYLDPQSMNASKKVSSQIVQTLGGQYGFVVVFGLMGAVCIYISLRSAYRLIVKNTQK
jgi:hypothetical protein